MRTLRVIGSKIYQTEFTVYVDGKLVEGGSDCLYRFETDCRLHGSSSVIINVIKGQITLENCIVAYPARINRQESLIEFVQPIANPVAVFENSKLLVKDFPVTINEGQTFEYEHLQFNGPDKFEVQLFGNFYDKKLWAGNFLTNNLNPAINKFQDLYFYEKKPNDIMDSKDLENLLLEVETKRGQYVN